MKTRTFSIGEAVSFGWKKQQENLWFFAGVTLFVVVLSLAFSAVNDYLSETDYIAGAVTSIITNIIRIFIGLGAMRIALNAYDNKKLQFSDLFSQQSVLLSAIGAVVISTILTVTGLILLIIPGIWILCRLYFTEAIIVHKKMGSIDALKESWRLTEKNSLRIFGFLIVLLGINILGALAFMIGLLVSIPVTTLAIIHAYRNLSGSENKEDLNEEDDEKENNTNEEEIAEATIENKEQVV